MSRARVLQRYADEAVAFAPAHPRPGDPAALRVAATLLTNGLAVAALNELGVPAETGASYRYVNVHNPRCPLAFDAGLGAWVCDPALRDHPAWGLNWAGARLICRHLGARLPREHEWEAFASNNEPERTYPWGDAPPSSALANFGEHFGGTTPVGRFPPSPIGLYDLAGNLSEWCEDPFAAPGERGAAFERVAKGGAWSKDAHHLEITRRRHKWERLGTTTIGLRPVWDVPSRPAAGKHTR